MNSKQLSVVGALIFIVAFVGMAFVILGNVPAIVFTIASVGGFSLWMFTTYRTLIDTQKVIVPYLLTIIFFVMMFAELSLIFPFLKDRTFHYVFGMYTVAIPAGYGFYITITEIKKLRMN